MSEDCDFKTEHADGSFIDHLSFCHDYSAIHYPSHSPRVLFVHSIMGVGTNLFPMAKEKIPQLASILNPEEMAHVQAFPSILRIVNDFSLLEALENVPADQVKGIDFHRLIDNESIHLTAEQLWVQLNYQLIHTMDFLPISNWPTKATEGIFQTFIVLLRLLETRGKLQVNVDMSCTGLDEAGDRVSLEQISDWHQENPELAAEKRVMSQGFSRMMSEEIGHSLKFDIETEV
eukprot:TRINITY_DN38217_c0_g1_i3.p1 TRINITY_DN38217_c0_g1~~TRINITY_DN38217_c0_g1_i3.p1  ORF type:complete len:232 (-),score=45.18 TRINITY_DN38217_c0_g1_i3:144-839(-)